MAHATLPKGYEPRDVEAKWRSHWEENKTFTPDPDGPGEPYSIVIPPPNVTGALHMGHALNLTIQDILCRYHRQKGRKVLWVPGTDHAGIATQNVVERKLQAEGKTRHDLGREAFVEKVWEWRAEYGDKILNQIRALGASVDWTRERFTFDEGLSRAVREVFVRLHEEGLIYKGEYIINWCHRCHTALADDEVEHESKQGKLYYIRYPLVDGSGDLIVATTRPETLLGDTAVAVNPEDERFNAHVGSRVRLPLTDRELTVIGDAYVDMEFGTGCLKVTPAHDPNDWELGRKHGLEILSVFDDNGMVNDNAPETYRGLDIPSARKMVVADLEALGLLVKVEDYEHSVGHCYRCKSAIDPHVSTQWFVAVRSLAEAARAAVPEKTRILPEMWAKVYYNWMDNIRDWCVSRQIWWGHRIPAWTCEDCGELIVSREDPTECGKCGSSSLSQDEDVLDTWFSSALWPFSTMGWPDRTRELKVFYPTSVLVTAFDILFFWVARMMMMGIHFMDRVPFHDVYIHALVRDAEGRKMSKSLGNIIDPLEMIDRFGTDSLRFTLAAFAAMGRDVKMSEDRVEGYRHFVNKLWNAARFALMKLPETMPDATLDRARELGAHHAWILHRLEEVKADVDTAVPEYRFNDAAQSLYRFIWHEFCDWYLEMIKPELTESPGEGEEAGRDAAAERAERAAVARVCLWTVLRETLVLLHPIMPFVTREIWSYLPESAASDAKHAPELAAAPFPERRERFLDPSVVRPMTLIQGVVVAMRNIRAELSINPGYKLDCLVRTESDEDKTILEANRDFISVLARLASFTAGPDLTAPKASASAVVEGNQVYAPLSGAVDFDAELERLGKELAKVEKDITVVNKKLANESFVAKAPADVVAKEREKADALADKQGKLEELRVRLRSAMESI